jgi:hypothetical protein
MPPKKTNKKCCKKSHHVRDTKSREHYQTKLPIFIAKFFIKLFFNFLSEFFKNKIIIQHLNAEPEKVLYDIRPKQHEDHTIKSINQNIIKRKKRRIKDLQPKWVGQP